VEIGAIDNDSPLTDDQWIELMQLPAKRQFLKDSSLRDISLEH